MDYLNIWQQESVLQQSLIIINSYQHFIREPLIETEGSPLELAQALFEAPFPIFSHNTDSDPLYNYANQKGLELWEVSWEELLKMPSRSNTQLDNQQERSRVLNESKLMGFSRNYQGVRLSRSGKKYLISNTILWNLRDRNHNYCGQAAAIFNWKSID